MHLAYGLTDAFNAVAEVKAHVAQLGGYLAERFYGHGAVEALEYFFPEC